MKTGAKSRRSAGTPPVLGRTSGPERVEGAARPRTSARAKPVNRGQAPRAFRMFLVPCSCGTTFAVAEDYDRQGTAWSRYMVCPECGKRHDPKNRLLRMGFQSEGYWKVDGC